MSAARPSSQSTRVSTARKAAPQPGAAPQPRDISMLHARRRQANRRRRLLRVDVGLGVFGALVLLFATPGLAIAAIFAGVLLALCAASVLAQRRSERHRRGSSSDARRRTRPETRDAAPSATADAARRRRR